MAFSYDNTLFVPSGTYSGRVDLHLECPMNTGKSLGGALIVLLLWCSEAAGARNLLEVWPLQIEVEVLPPEAQQARHQPGVVPIHRQPHHRHPSVRRPDLAAVDYSP